MRKLYFVYISLIANGLETEKSLKDLRAMQISPLRSGSALKKWRNLHFLSGFYRVIRITPGANFGVDPV